MKFELGKFKMGSSSGGYGHSWERSNSGRKRKHEEQNDCGKNHKRICLESRIFQSWLQAKFDVGYESCSDSDFTAQLLIVEGKLCLHNSFDLYTVNDVFLLTYFYLVSMWSFVGHWKIWQEGRVAYLDLLSKSSSCQM